MEPGVYAAEAEVEAHHWWFVGRRELFAREIARAGVEHPQVGAGARPHVQHP